MHRAVIIDEHGLRK